VSWGEGNVHNEHAAGGEKMDSIESTACDGYTEMMGPVRIFCRIDGAATNKHFKA